MLLSAQGSSWLVEASLDKLIKEQEHQSGLGVFQVPKLFGLGASAPAFPVLVSAGCGVHSLTGWKQHGNSD